MVERKELDARDLIPIKEAAEAFGVTVPGFRRWIEGGLIDGYQIGKGRIYVKRADLPKLIRPLAGKKSQT
jgi:excisionase family DNA binding protein